MPYGYGGNYVSPFSGAGLFSRDLWEAQPGGGWSLFSNALGGRSGTPFADWLNQQYGKEYQGFLGKAATNPELRWTDYLDNRVPGLWGDFSSLPRSQRGLGSAVAGRNKYEY